MDLEDKKPSPAQRQLLDALGNLTESISFCAKGTSPLVLPGLTVEGVGEISLPISKSAARKLIKQAGQAPYGRGEATIVDTDVRSVWQLEPDQFRLDNLKWQSLVGSVANSVKSDFGIQQKVTADLYKLLIYEKGSFFVPHRDTEKAHRMFATLVICLPSKHEGGELIVSHAGQSQVVDFSGNTSTYELQYAAFYADCQHEIRPVTDGYRICLVYNLSTGGRKQQPVAPEFSDSVDAATKAIEVMLDEDDERDMIIMPLTHQYTEAGLAPDKSAEDSADVDDDDDEFHALDSATEHTADKSANSSSRCVPLEFKGVDQARADVLSQVAARTNCRAFVALLTHWQSGYPDYGTVEHAPYGRHWGRGYEDVSAKNEQAEFEEIYDETISLKHWHTLSGQRQPFDEIHIDESNIVNDVDNKDRPYRQTVHEATGNEGMSMERWYHQAVIVLWPEARHYHVLASQGTKNSVPALHELVESTKDPAKCDDCKSFAQMIIDRWTHATGGHLGVTDPLGTSLVRSLLAIGDTKLAGKFFEQVLPLEYATLDGEPLLGLAELARWKAIEKSLLSFFGDQKPDNHYADLRGLVTTFGALASLGESVSADRKRVCKSALKAVTTMLARWEQSQPTTKWDRFSSTQSNTFVGVVEPLVRGLCAVGTRSDLKHLLTQIEAHPKHYDLHSVLIPAVKNLASDEHFAESNKLAKTTVSELRQFCVDQLTQRTAQQPEPPKNWKRVAKLSCKCADCQELVKFLQDKDIQVHRFPRRKELRQHLHRQIDGHRIDCAHVTDRRGRPYTLVCTKNQASFERDLKQYNTDCQLLTELTDDSL